MFRPRERNIPGKMGESNPAGCTTGNRPSGPPRTRWCDYISDLAYSHLCVEPAGLSLKTVRVVLRVIGLLSPRTPPRKIGCETLWMKVLKTSVQRSVTWKLHLTIYINQTNFSSMSSFFKRLPMQLLSVTHPAQYPCLKALILEMLTAVVWSWPSGCIWSKTSR